MSWMAEFEAGMALALDEYRRLQSLDSSHELLRYGNVKPEDDEIFYLSEENKEDFNKRFAREGIKPRGAPACAVAIAQFYLALRDAADKLEGVVRTSNESKLVQQVDDSPDGFPF